MPTAVYDIETGHKYEVENSVNVDEMLASKRFSLTKPGEPEEVKEEKPKPTNDPEQMTKVQLVEYAQEKLGLELDLTSTKAELLQAVQGAARPAGKKPIRKPVRKKLKRE
jgi:hypothetical protein